MKVIDKTEKYSEELKEGDCIKCWTDNDARFDLYQIGKKDNKYIPFVLSDRYNTKSITWRRTYSSMDALIYDLTHTYSHIQKVQVEIAILNAVYIKSHYLGD